jgi:uncharacterized membrane protein
LEDILTCPESIGSIFESTNDLSYMGILRAIHALILLLQTLYSPINLLLKLLTAIAILLRKSLVRCCGLKNRIRVEHRESVRTRHATLRDNPNPEQEVSQPSDVQVF